MRDAFTILISFIFLITSFLAVSAATSRKDLRHRDEYRVGITGALAFMYISWIIVYISNIHPFVKPEFIKAKSPEYYGKQ